MRQFQSEQFQALLRVKENPKGKITRHWLWRVKDIPHTAWSQSQTKAIVVRGKCVTKAPPSLLFYLYRANSVGFYSTPCHVNVWVLKGCGLCTVMSLPYTIFTHFAPWKLLLGRLLLYYLHIPDLSEIPYSKTWNGYSLKCNAVTLAVHISCHQTWSLCRECTRNVFSFAIKSMVGVLPFRENLISLPT